ncbi:tyrosine-type recombinase/integrase [Nocardia cyriacigeorgica]|uniref:tyrosine-type recombinase/integrase n=1 Tax=Nocardia cyriacigeorgica TaxID=135487 RepID=UPI0024568C4D|nr:tyrosine-type recombinase/integrase [Nocardia cyriacigeorgica]
MTAPSTTIDAASAPGLDTAGDYLELSPQRRYDIVSRRFPAWLLAEPIEFPPHHITYGWACRVEGCACTSNATDTRLLCIKHSRALTQVKGSISFEEFLASAEPYRARSGWALVRRSLCRVDGCPREIDLRRYCLRHSNSFDQAQRRGIGEHAWAADQNPLPPLQTCWIDRCVHDARISRTVGAQTHTICSSHAQQVDRWLQSHDRPPADWAGYFDYPYLVASVSAPTARGQLSLIGLPVELQREIRYALHRYANNPRRTQWRPTALQEVVDALAAAGVRSLAESAYTELASSRQGNQRFERRIWQNLPAAARSLTITADISRAEGWFDPLLLGAAPFPDSQGPRRTPWDLTGVTQQWLRDLLWDYLSDEALKPSGKRPCSGGINDRITGIALLSRILEHNRTDHGIHPEMLRKTDAQAVKQTWDLWFGEQIPLPTVSAFTRERVLSEATRRTFTAAACIVLRLSREKGRTVAQLDPFIFNLPEYPAPPKKPRPRPLTYDDFQLLVNPDSLRQLDALDEDNLGYSDIWLAQAFQGGRISETLGLRVGCIGLVGAAQPYLWRDIAKVGIIDYGMPCYLPVYERLLRRQEATRARLRFRYREQLAELGDRGRAQVEASWDALMPLFPGTTLNPDLTLEISQSWFRQIWTRWFEHLGLTSITTHQTRATLATSLLNNGAPAALVRQLLGHFSEEALAHYANYNSDIVARHLKQVWAASPGMNKPGTILLRPGDLTTENPADAAARIDLTVVPVEHGLCRYGPVVGGATCPYGKNCSEGPKGPCEHFVLTGADLAYWERKRDAAAHFAEGAPSDEARDYILRQWEPWEPVLAGLREVLDELGLLEAAEKLDLRTPVHDYFDPLFSNGWRVAHLSPSPPSSDDKI